jgi:hypothetical protein
MSIYNPCPCGSGKKFKFCCSLIAKSGNQQDLEKVAASWPVEFCIWSEIKDGLATVFLSRKMPDGHFMAATYLVDLWCLGVKNADFRKKMTQGQLQDFHNGWKQKMNLIPIEYEKARSLVLGGVAYAQSFGFDPHPDWKYAKCLIDPDRSFEEQFEFGKDGKPYYFSGPNDKNKEEIMEKMRRIGGNFTVFIGEPET